MAILNNILSPFTVQPISLPVVFEAPPEVAAMAPIPVEETNTTLSPTQMLAIEDARSSHGFALKLFAKRVGEKDRLALVIGEFHGHRRRAAMAGVHLVQEFPHREVEGVDVKTQDGQVAQVSAMALGGVVSFWERLPGSYSSTIAAAAAISPPAWRAEKLRLSLARRLEEAAANTGEKARLDEAVFIVNNSLGSYSSKLELSLAEAEEIVRGGKLGSGDCLSLEEGHVMGVHERIAYTSYLSFFSLVVAGALVSFATEYFAAPELLAADMAILHATKVSVCWLLGGLLYGYALPSSNPLRCIIDPLGGLVSGRNMTMAGNLSQNVESAADDEPHLAVMGWYHARHFSKVLQGEHGFREVKVPRMDRRLDDRVEINGLQEIASSLRSSQ